MFLVQAGLLGATVSHGAGSEGLCLAIDRRVLEQDHSHRNLDTSKRKESKSITPAQSHSGIQPSTSKPGKKSPPQLQVDALSSDKLSKKKKLIPKIIVTGPSDEVLINSFTDELPETKTIRETEDYGAYAVHSRPSTVDAYRISKAQ